MGLFDTFRKKKKRRMIVLGLDGMPFSFLMRETEKGTLPNLASILKKGSVRPMTSVIPPISSVAWSTLMTGVNPAQHNIFGFVDRTPDPFEMFIPTAKNRKAPSIYDYLGKNDKRVVVVNVPVTYPPREVNGILVGGFLSTSLEKAVYPKSHLSTLKELDYRIDVDAWEAHADIDNFLTQLFEVLDRRFRALNYFHEKEEWDFLMEVVMETDRLYHFYWEHYENIGSERYNEFIKFHQKLDNYIGEFLSKLRDEDDLIILSDHGFCTLKNEFNLNVFLRDKGLLKINENGKGFDALDPASKAYSLIPGRIFVNLAGREAQGSVKPGDEYENVRSEVIDFLNEVKDPETNEGIWEGIYRREEIYGGPYLESAADIIALPKDGYEVKGGFKMGELWSKDKFIGCHSYADAFMYVKNGEINQERATLLDLAPTVLAMMDVPVPPELEGRVLV